MECMHFALIVIVLAPLFGFAEPWKIHESRIKGTVEKIQNLEIELGLLIKNKELIESKEDKKKNLVQIVEKSNELKKMKDDFREESYHMRYEHPARESAVEDKKYKAQKLSSDEAYGDSGLHGELNSMKSKIHSAFGAPEIKATPTPLPTPTPTPEPQGIKLEF